MIKSNRERLSWPAGGSPTAGRAISRVLAAALALAIALAIALVVAAPLVEAP